MKLKPRSTTSHKGQNGTVLVVGGSEDYIGAPTLVGLSALATLRAGADLVTVAAPSKVAWAINCISPDLITRKIACTNFTARNVPSVFALAKTVDVVEIGNGIAFTPGAAHFMKQLISKLVRLGKPLVLDAAALRVIRIQDVRNAVLLPHGGEYATLLRNSRLTDRNVQKHLGSNVLVKKGHPRTAILSSTKKKMVSAGNAGMTHGGTGDVLAGIITGLIAQGNDALAAAQIGVHVNGKTADALYKKMGFGYLASDLVSTFPLFLKKFQRLK